jgi:hypothetical protein
VKLAQLLILLLIAAPAQASAPVVAAPPGYEAVWESLPLRHRQLVRSIQIDRTSSGQSRRSTMSIHLPPHRGKASDVTLVHELCHLIAYANPELEQAWDKRFWPHGKPVGRPPTEYAESAPEEDWAVSCEKARDGDGPDDQGRAAFIRAWRVWP